MKKQCKKLPHIGFPEPLFTHGFCRLKKIEEDSHKPQVDCCRKGRSVNVQ